MLTFNYRLVLERWRKLFWKISHQKGGWRSTGRGGTEVVEWGTETLLNITKFIVTLVTCNCCLQSKSKLETAFSMNVARWFEFCGIDRDQEFKMPIPEHLCPSLAGNFLYAPTTCDFLITYILKNKSTLERTPVHNLYASWMYDRNRYWKLGSPFTNLELNFRSSGCSLVMYCYCKVPIPADLKESCCSIILTRERFRGKTHRLCHCDLVLSLYSPAHLRI